MHTAYGGKALVIKTQSVLGVSFHQAHFRLKVVYTHTHSVCTYRHTFMHTYVRVSVVSRGRLSPLIPIGLILFLFIFFFMYVSRRSKAKG